MLIGRDDEDARRAAKLAVAIGVRNLGGFLAGGMTSWRAEHRDVERLERIQRARSCTSARAGRAASRSSTCASCAEWEDVRIPGSIHIPYHDIHGVPDRHRRRATGRRHLLVGQAAARSRPAC